MSKIDELIAELCPEGVEFKELGKLGRRNKGTPITAGKMKELHIKGAPVRVFAGGKTVADVSYDAINEKNVITTPSIIVKSRGHIDVEYYDKPFTHKNELWSYSIDETKNNQKFIYYYLLTQIDKLQQVARATSVKLPQLSVSDTDNLKIPIPPHAVQQEIVDILDKFTQLEAELEAELEARKKQYEHYRNQLLTFDGTGGVQWTELGEIMDFTNGKPHEKHIEIGGQYVAINSRFISTDGRVRKHTNKNLTPASKGDLVMVMSDLPNGKALAKSFYIDADDTYTVNQRVCLLSPKDATKTNSRFLHYILNRNKQLLRYDSGMFQTHLTKGQFLKVKVPNISKEKQDKIAATLDTFDNLLDGASESLPAELASRRKQYEYYRNKLLTFKELKV